MQRDIQFIHQKNGVSYKLKLDFTFDFIFVLLLKHIDYTHIRNVLMLNRVGEELFYFWSVNRSVLRDRCLQVVVYVIAFIMNSLLSLL